MTRAPSRCRGRPSSSAISRTARLTSVGTMVPPALLCVFSSEIRPVGLWWTLRRMAARTSSGAGTPRGACTKRGTTPEKVAIMPSSHSYT